MNALKLMVMQHVLLGMNELIKSARHNREDSTYPQARLERGSS